MTNNPYTGECKDCYQHVLSPECDGHGIRVGEPCPFGKPMEQKNEPTTGEIVRALRGGGIYGITTALELKVIARLESQERELSGITGELERMTARAEQAERERDELKEKVIDYELAERGF